MPNLTQSDLADLARYPASLRSAARALWGNGLATDRSDPTHHARAGEARRAATPPVGESG